MKTRKSGFTMIELMIVIVIVAVLSSVIVPMLRGRLQRAKWSEGMAGCSSIATSIRAWAAENAHDAGNHTLPTDLAQLGFRAGDLTGKYFDAGDYAISNNVFTVAADGTMTLTYTITATGDADETTAKPEGTLTLNQLGAFTLVQDGVTSSF